MESFRHIGQKVERRHRDVLNVVVLHKCKLLHPLVEYKGDAVVEECLPKHLLNKISKDCFSGVKLYQKVESSVRLHILKDSQHCHRIDSCERVKLVPASSNHQHPAIIGLHNRTPEMIEAKVAVWKRFIFSHISSANMKRRPKATIAVFKVVPTKAICRIKKDLYEGFFVFRSFS